MTATTTAVTELGTALGMLVGDRSSPLAELPRQLRFVSPEAWDRFATAAAGDHAETFAAAFDNGRHFFRAQWGLRSREPLVIDWKGPHRPPGDDVAPIDLRVDHVFLVSCKYLSKVMLNSGPFRLFDRGLLGEERSSANWFAVVAPLEYSAFFSAVRSTVAPGIAETPERMSAADRDLLKAALGPRQLPEACIEPWSQLVTKVSNATAERWSASLTDRKAQLRLLWRMLRITDAPYFVLGADRLDPLRLRVSSRWDWSQDFELRHLDITPRLSGQPEVGWSATVRRRESGDDVVVSGHVEIRWSHGRFQGVPEAKVYLDTRHGDVPGYSPLV